jgi:hypothetical protein
MPKIYEIHDTILHSIDREDAQVVVRLRAIRTEFDESGDSSSRCYRQEVKLLFKSAVMETDSQNLPNWLLDGSFACERCTADSADIVEGVFPASLTHATNVDVRLEGMNEDTQEYISIQIHAPIMTLEALGEPEFIQEV